jgi:hypothetical protein
LVRVQLATGQNSASVCKKLGRYTAHGRKVYSGHVLLQKNQTTVLLDEVVTGLGKKVALGLFVTPPTKQRDDAAQAKAYGVAKGYTEAHCLLMGLA